MKKITHLGVLLIICIGAAILFYTSRYQFKSISAHNFAILIDTADVNIVDVRTSKEHDLGHIPGTNYNIDVKGDSFVFQSLMLLTKDTPVALYCRSGNRSKTAAKLLAKKGYKVYELSSGFNGWREAGYAAADSLIVIDDSQPKLKIYYPQYDSIDLVCGTNSPESNHKAIFSCAAAFTGATLDEFLHSNINGDHAYGGKYHKGSPYNRGCFAWYNGTWTFTDKDKASSTLKTAAKYGGMGFRQILLILNGEKKPAVMARSNIYRALCELNDKLCIIESKSSIPLPEFIDELGNIGVKNAIYLDMGGWNHSWYRKYEHYPVSYIHKSSHNYYTNWLTFYASDSATI